MNVFRDLYISANAETMARAVAEMEGLAATGWRRDKAAETRARTYAPSNRRPAYCFACEKGNRRASAMLTLAQKDPETFFVSNIMPIERYQLEHVEYNGVLEDFLENVFKPIADKLRMAYTLTDPEAGLGRWMDGETAEKLREFSSFANKGLGASHPLDRSRWNAFVLSAHRNGCELDPSTLARWLVEEEDWSPEIAERLALEYESGRGMLAFAHVH